jgi:hypothetical protein
MGDITVPNTLLLTAATGRKNFSILIRDRDEIAYDEDEFNPTNEGELLAATMWNMLPWSTVQSMMNKMGELAACDE